MKTILTIATGLSLSTCAAAPAVSSEECPITIAVYDGLTVSGLERHSLGLVSGVMIETWANTVTGRWYILATSTEGYSCIVATGTDYVRIPAPNV